MRAGKDEELCCFIREVTSGVRFGQKSNVLQALHRWMDELVMPLVAAKLPQLPEMLPATGVFYPSAEVVDETDVVSAYIVKPSPHDSAVSVFVPQDGQLTPSTYPTVDAALAALASAHRSCCSCGRMRIVSRGVLADTPSPMPGVFVSDNERIATQLQRFFEPSPAIRQAIGAMARAGDGLQLYSALKVLFQKDQPLIEFLWLEF